MWLIRATVWQCLQRPQHFQRFSALNHQLSGLGSLAYFKGLVAKIAEGDVASLAADLAGLYERFQQAPQSAMVIADEAEVPQWVDALLARGTLTQSGPAQQRILADQTAIETAYVTETEVNFCAAAYRCPSESKCGCCRSPGVGCGSEKSVSTCRDS